MNPQDDRQELASNAPGFQVSAVSIPQLVGDVYESAPVVERTRLLEYLMQPLGVLSLAVVANGIFSKIRFRSGWPELHIRPEEAQYVRVNDVVALVDYVQQASSEAIDGLIQLMSTPSAMAGSAAAALLVSVLVQRARSRRAAGADDAGDLVTPS
jgi:hypothetical protein